MIRVSFGMNNLITTKLSEPDWKTATRRVGSIALSRVVPPPKETSGEERGLLSRTAAGNRAYKKSCWCILNAWSSYRLIDESVILTLGQLVLKIWVNTYVNPAELGGNQSRILC